MQAERKVNIQVLMPLALADALRREALSSDRTLAQVMREAARNYVRERGQARRGVLPGQLELAAEQ